jgi:hypothetical protein
MLPGSGSRSRYTPRREPETPREYGRRGERPEGKSVSLPMSRSETRQGKVSLWKEREGWLWKKGDSVSKEAFSGERKSTGAEVPVVRRSVSVNVTDAVTQSITDDVGMSGCRPSKGCSVFGRDNCKGTGSYCWDPGGVSAVNERY